MIVGCLACKAALNVVGPQREVDQLVGTGSDFYPDKYVCFRCGGVAIPLGLSPELEPRSLQLLEVHEVTPAEAFAALSGMGVPAEKTCCREVLEELLAPLGIKLHGKQLHGLNRFFVDSLELPDGTRIHMAASSQGAAVYRITNPTSYAGKVLDDAG